MNVPSRPAPPPPNRFIRTFTLGTGSTLDSRGISSLATSPNEGSVDTTPFRIVNLGKDQASKNVTIPAQQAGNLYTATTTIALPRLPGYTANQPPNGPSSTPRAPAVSRIDDQLIFAASMTVQNAIGGLTISRFTALPQARSTDTGQVFNGPTLPAGQRYTSFQVFCTVIFSAKTATSAGVITVSAEGEVTRQAGGAAT